MKIAPFLFMLSLFLRCADAALRLAWGRAHGHVQWRAATFADAKFFRIPTREAPMRSRRVWLRRTGELHDLWACAPPRSTPAPPSPAGLSTPEFSRACEVGFEFSAHAKPAFVTLANFPRARSRAFRPRARCEMCAVPKDGSGRARVRDMADTCTASRDVLRLDAKLKFNACKCTLKFACLT